MTCASIHVCNPVNPSERAIRVLTRRGPVDYSLPQGQPLGNAAVNWILCDEAQSVAFNPVDYGAVGGNQALDTAGFNAAIAAASQSDCQCIAITCPPSGEPYVLSGVTSPEPLVWNFMGGQVRVAGSVLINGEVVSPCKTIFILPEATADQSLLKIRDPEHPDTISQHQHILRPHWFETDGKDPEEWGHRANLAFQVGGTASYVDFGPGKFWGQKETISLDENRYGSHLVLAGESWHATHLQADAGESIVLIDASKSDESVVRGMKASEATGARTCMCLALGGTSFLVQDFWAGNAKYGLYQNQGTGTRVDTVLAENNDFNRFIESGHFDNMVIDAPPASAGISDLDEVQVMYHGGGVGLHIGRQINQLTGFQFTNLTTKNTAGDGVEIVSNNPAGVDGMIFTGFKAFNNGGYGFRATMADAQIVGGFIADAGAGAGILADAGIVNAHCITYGNRVGAQGMPLDQVANGGTVNQMGSLPLR